MLLHLNNLIQSLLNGVVYFVQTLHKLLYILQLCCLKLWGWLSANQPSTPSKYCRQKQSHRKWDLWFSKRHLAHWVSVEPVSECVSRAWNIKLKSWVLAATVEFIDVLTRTGILTATSQVPDRDSCNFPPLTSLGELFSFPLSWYLFLHSVGHHPLGCWKDECQYSDVQSALLWALLKSQAWHLQFCNPMPYPLWNLSFREMPPL